jgi:hypothetical protein
MNRRSAVALLATLVVPAAVFAWLGERVARGQPVAWDGRAARLV